MAALKVLRQTLAGTSTAYTFDVAGTKFLVKNLSDADVLVNFEDITNDNESTSIKIPTLVSQIVLSNEISHFGYKTIYAKGTGEVEIQIVRW